MQSRLIIWLLRHRHFFKGRLRPEIVDSTFSVDKFRDGIDRMSRKIKWPKDIEREETRIGNMQAEWIFPKDAPGDRVVLYIHGGGFISGSCLTHRAHVAKFARGSGLKYLLFDYRLAPENPFPAALEDCVEAYEYLLQKGFKAEQIVVGGESAGATLTLSLLLELKNRSLPLPVRAFSISPVCDLSCRAASFSYNASRDVAPMGSWDVWTKMYIAGNNPESAPLSPAFGNFRGIPPLMICVGTHEIHLDDCDNIARLASDAGVKVALYRKEGMIHAFPLLSPMFPEALEAMNSICAFIREGRLKEDISTK
jgi:epsilon-lactone hydrolase